MCKSRGVDKLLSCARVLFTFGEVLEEEDYNRKKSEDPGSDEIGRPVSHVTYNGLIASIQVFGLLVSVAAALTLSTGIGVPEWHESANIGALMVFMVGGACVMTVFLKCRREAVAVGWHRGVPGPAAEIEVEEEPGRSWNLIGGKSRVIIAGLVLYCVVSTPLDLLNLAAQSYCFERQRRECPGLIVQPHILHLIFHLIRSIYLVVATAFCLVFHACRFFDTCLIRYGLVILQAINLSLWFDATVHKKYSIYHHPNTTSYHHRHFCPGSDNTSHEVTDCTELAFFKVVLYDVSPLIRPFTIQFTLLIATFFCQWFFQCVKAKDTRAGAGSVREMQDRRGSSRRGTERRRIGEEGPPVETTPLLPVRTFSLARSGEASDDFRLPTSDFRSPTLKLWLITIIIVNGLLIVLAVTTSNPQLIHYALLFYWISMSIAILVGIQVSRKFSLKRDATRFTGFDYLLLFTSTGPVAFVAFTFVAVAGSGAGAGTIVDQAIYLVFDLLQVFFQVSFTLYSARLCADVTTANPRSVTCFRAVIFYLAMSNGSLWISNTISDISIPREMQRQFYGNDKWIVMYNVVKPLALFFRFNSCLQFTRVYRNRFRN